ncbi:MAG TPA: ABC transporter permease [Acidimicrobiales bacterium]|nr:ABC transporter permease [Acidimicrobiales bacterium]
MDTFLQYTILGLVTGGVYGIAASGLVVTYTTSGIFNFAHGAVAMLAAFTYWQLRWGWGWPAPVALVVVLGVLAPLLGALLYGVVMRGLRGTSEVARIVVPVSVMLGFLALSTWIWDPTPRSPRLFLLFFGADKTVSIGGVNLAWHEMAAVVIALLVALGLRFLFFGTRTGVAMRAVVDDPDLLELNAGRPERLAMASWALGAFLAALAGVLITPIMGSAMSAQALTLLVIDAFAAAMFGRLRSVPRTFVGALVLGLAGSYVIGYFPAQDWTWTGNFRVSLPMIALFVVLLFLPQDRLRGATVLRSRERYRMPTMRNALIAAVVLVAGMWLLRGILAPTAINSLAFGMTMAVMALSLVLLTGYAGEINLAVLSFGAIGAIIVHHFGVSGSGSGARSTLFGYAAAAVVCAVVGALVALPSLRLRGLYLALSTMAFGVFVSHMLLREITVRKLPLIHTEFSIFPSGNLGVPRPKFGPVDLAAMPSFLMFVTVLFAVLGVGLVALRHSGYGRRLTAMKDSPAASATLGQSMVTLKLSVFMLSAAIAGVGGALMTSQIGSANLDRFDIFLSLSLLMLTVVGGIGYVSGALFGGVAAGVLFVAMQDTFAKLGFDHPDLEGFFDFMANLTLVLPALMGVSIGRNPTGTVEKVLVEFAPVRRARPVLVGGIAVVGVGYLLARNGTISNWWLIVLTAAVVVAMPVLATRLVPAAASGADGGSGGASAGGAPLDGAPPADLPLELVGVARPYSVADREMLDAALGVPAGTAVPAAPDAPAQTAGAR